MSEFVSITTPLPQGWEEPSQWLTERLGEPYRGEATTDNSYDGSGFADCDRAWQAYFDPGVGKFWFDIKDPGLAMMFKLTFA